MRHSCLPLPAAFALLLVACSATPQAAPASTGAAKTDTLCAADDQPLFSCALAPDARAVSLCVKDGHPYFAGGPTRLSATPPSIAAKGITRTTLGFAGNTGGYAYAFEEHGTKRILYAISGTEGMEEQGLIVIGADASAPAKSHACLPGTFRNPDDAAVSDVTARWPEDASIARHGLPRHD